MTVFSVNVEGKVPLSRMRIVNAECKALLPEGGASEKREKRDTRANWSITAMVTFDNEIENRQ